MEFLSNDTKNKLVYPSFKHVTFKTQQEVFADLARYIGLPSVFPRGGELVFLGVWIAEKPCQVPRREKQ